MLRVTHIKEHTGETLKIGPLTVYILEDGHNTDNRLGAVSLVIPAHTTGPPQHWHRMHDETFLITRGTVRFTTGEQHYDAKAGDYIVVPVGRAASHTFSNPFDEEAEFFNSFTPAWYVDYLRLLSQKGNMSEGEQRNAMAQFATFPPDELS